MKDPDKLDVEIARVIREYEDQIVDIWGTPTRFVGIVGRIRDVVDKHYGKESHATTS